MSTIEMPDKTAQQRFDETYITATEISRQLSVSRPAVLKAKQRGYLPDPVHVGDQHVTIWERATVEPYLKAWKHSLNCRKQGSDE